jgi:thiosulfate/3-mercaptopyruvate sulfurtransferase
VNDIELEELSARLGELKVVDVRHEYEYDGSFGSPCDPRQGHLPGAVNLDVDELQSLSAEEVTERLGVEPGAEIVVYCHSGSRSARAAMILQYLGFQGRNYPGSWHEWSQTDLPIEP